MKIIGSEYKVCPCCMKEHEVKFVEIKENNIFKGQYVEYAALYEYCDITDEMFASAKMMSDNDISMKNVYRRQNGLLTSEEIVAIRKKYDVSQSDLALILGCGEKTITRYEGHQVQDAVYNSVLKKVDSDPRWYLELLEGAREKLGKQVYEKYYKRAIEILNNAKDTYLKKAMEARYLNFSQDAAYCNDCAVDIESIVNDVNYFLDDLNKE